MASLATAASTFSCPAPASPSASPLAGCTSCSTAKMLMGALLSTGGRGKSMSSTPVAERRERVRLLMLTGGASSFFSSSFSTDAASFLLFSSAAFPAVAGCTCSACKSSASTNAAASLKGPASLHTPAAASSSIARGRTLPRLSKKVLGAGL